MMLSKCCTQYARHFGKLSIDRGLEKCQFSFQSQRKATPKNVQATAHLHSFHMLARKFILKILQARLQQYVNRELPDVQAKFRKGRGIRDQIANIQWIMEKAREFQKNICFCFIDYIKTFLTVWITTNCGKFLNRNIRSPYLRNLYAGQEIRHGTMA